MDLCKHAFILQYVAAKCGNMLVVFVWNVC